MDKMEKLLTAFYGGSIPNREVESLCKSISKTVDMLEEDIRVKFPDVTDTELEAGVIIAFRMLGDLGAAHPNNYGYNSERTIGAFQAAVRKISAMRAEAKRKRERNLDLIEPTKTDAEAEALLDKFERLRVEFGAVDGYIQLLRSTPNFNGYSYYLACYKIPSDAGIYDNDAVIQAHNDHKQLGADRQRGKSLGNVRL